MEFEKADYLVVSMVAWSVAEMVNDWVSQKVALKAGMTAPWKVLLTAAYWDQKEVGAKDDPSVA